MIHRSTQRLRASNHHLIISAALLALPACNADGLTERNLGDTSALLTGEDPVASERVPVIDGVSIDPFIAGTWLGSAIDPFGSPGSDGSLPSYVFPSGSSDITLELALPTEDSEETSFPVGTLTFGAGPAPEPLAGVAFPPGHDYYGPAFTAFVGVGPVFAPAEGFPYPVRRGLFPIDGDFTAGLLPISYDQNAPFVNWCPLQPSVPTQSGDFNCGGGSRGFSGGLPPNPEPCAYTDEDGTEDAVDCDLATLCSGDATRGDVCECSESGCEARPGLASFPRAASACEPWPGRRTARGLCLPQLCVPATGHRAWRVGRLAKAVGEDYNARRFVILLPACQ